MVKSIKVMAALAAVISGLYLTSEGLAQAGGSADPCQYVRDPNICTVQGATCCELNTSTARASAGGSAYKNGGWCGHKLTGTPCTTATTEGCGDIALGDVC